jgi:hypothetical protein
LRLCPRQGTTKDRENGTSVDTNSFGLFVFFDGFVEVELEVGLFRYDVVVVGVKPSGKR